MSTTATGPLNGKPPRKQLADQLDRLDGVIDGLCDGLPRAVAEATRDGARQAVRDVILELLTNSDLRALIAGLAPAAPATVAAAPPPEPGPAGPGLWARLKARVVAAKAAVAARYTVVAATAAATLRTLSAVLPVRRVLAIGAGVGVAVGLASYLCPHGLSAVVSGVGGAVAAVATQVVAWARRSTRLLGLGGIG